LVTRYNGENRTVSPKPNSNNGIAMLAKLPETHVLHPNESSEKSADQAMDALFKDKTFVTGRVRAGSVHRSNPSAFL